MTPIDLQRHYPTIASAYAMRQPQPQLQGSPLEFLHENLFGDHVSDADRALELLLRRFTATDLDEQIRGLFAPRWNAWDAARTELLAFSTMEQDGILRSVAWPRGLGSAPFDAVIADVHGTNGLVAVDVKSAQGRGTGLLDERLTPVAEQWAAKLGLAAVQVEIDHRGGALTQENLDHHVGRLMRQFDAALAQHQAIPPAPVELVLNADTTIYVDVQAAADIVAHHGKVSPAERAASMYRVMSKHEAQKANHSATYNRHFVLVYVSPVGAGGADLRAAHVVEAARKLEPTASGWWLGTVFLDWTAGALQRTGYFRNPSPLAGSSAETLQRAFGCV